MTLFYHTYFDLRAKKIEELLKIDKSNEPFELFFNKFMLGNYQDFINTRSIEILEQPRTFFYDLINYKEVRYFQPNCKDWYQLRVVLFQSNVLNKSNKILFNDINSGFYMSEKKFYKIKKIWKKYIDFIIFHNNPQQRLINNINLF